MKKTKEVKKFEDMTNNELKELAKGVLNYKEPVGTPEVLRPYVKEMMDTLNGGEEITTSYTQCLSIVYEDLTKEFCRRWVEM